MKQNINFLLTKEKLQINDSKAFIEYSNYTDHIYKIYKKIDEYNPNKIRKLLIVLMI